MGMVAALDENDINLAVFYSTRVKEVAVTAGCIAVRERQPVGWHELYCRAFRDCAATGKEAFWEQTAGITSQTSRNAAE
jgi:hypothetical protein